MRTTTTTTSSLACLAVFWGHRLVGAGVSGGYVYRAGAGAVDALGHVDWERVGGGGRAGLLVAFLHVVLSGKFVNSQSRLRV